MYIDRFHMISRSYWCRQWNSGHFGVQRKSRRNLTLFLCKKMSFVPRNLHCCWPREWKRSIYKGRLSLWAVALTKLVPETLEFSTSGCCSYHLSSIYHHHHYHHPSSPLSSWKSSSSSSSFLLYLILKRLNKNTCVTKGIRLWPPQKGWITRTYTTVKILYSLSFQK